MLLRGFSSRAGQVRPAGAALAAPLRSFATAPLLPLAARLPVLSPASAAAAAPRFVAARAAATDAAPPPPSPAGETFTYQAEVDRLMDMIVNSLYSNREVFLRELVSNASDALDKARFLSLTDPGVLAGREELEIRISADKDNNTITIEDSGIGMSREQLLSNLGTIARSGTRKITLHLKEDAAEMADPVRLTRLIKQYSQFIAFPIKVYSPKKEPRKVVDSEATAKKQEAADKKAAEKGEESKPVEPVMKTEYDEVWDWRLENENKPIWTRSPKDVSETAYNDFFKCLGERVEKVSVSNRLLDSPCALVTSKFGWSANMERIMRSQALGDARSMEYMKGRKIMEINPNHDIIAGIKTLLQEKDEERARDLSELLYETALITSGFQVDSPKDYASKVFTLMKIALGYDILEEAEEAAAAAAPAAAAAEPQAAAPKAAAAPKGPVATPVDAEIVTDDPWKQQ
ncbi:hypothetical protein GPECTOR_35g891 [Gonium pectorale]|uniref:Histidine kinase/HSP90-like ATPase domain-containing protein n=1 Tax=Gonium pectorale TaxID=33097 RepID=A0A150GCF7_GONPE|nr:hypothetical protein GPECTOR_35g891 [Gonium pectorale]|eukprot:KXZ47453.1 hypothetical protein GPECTOR_35g891 [Gonium pectorale]